MIGFANTGSGRDRLLLRVRSGTGTPEESGGATAPRENDIWVDTDIAVSGFEFSETDYPTAEKESGFVYFTATYTGGYAARETTGLNFFKMKAGAHYAKLVRCWQYDGSQWKTRAAYIFHGEQWHQFGVIWDGTLFQNGNQYNDYTGGWTGMVSVQPEVVKDPANPALYSDASCVPIGDAFIRTVGKVDLTPFKTLKWNGWGYMSTSGGSDPAWCAVQDSTSINDGIITNTRFQSDGTYGLDISKITGSHYIAFYAQGSRGQRLFIRKVWLE